MSYINMSQNSIKEIPLPPPSAFPLPPPVPAFDNFFMKK
jgi:hypothetical protein